MSERPIDDVLRAARAVAACPQDGAAAAAAFPALVCDSIDTIDPARVCLTVYNGHPVTVWPKGLRPIDLQEEAQ